MNNTLKRKKQLESTEYINSLNPNPGFDISAIREAGIRSQVPIVSDATGYFLSMICALKQPETILEIGSGFSYSSHFLLAGYAGSTLTSLDTNLDRVNISREFCRQNGFEKRAEFKHEDANTYFENNPRNFDLIFLDSMKKEYPVLLESCVRYLNPQGLLVADNILFQDRMLPGHIPEPKYVKGIEGLRTFVERARNHPQLHTVFFPIDDGIMVSTKHTENR